MAKLFTDGSAEIVRKTQLWEVANFSQLRAQPGEVTESPLFDAFDRKWVLQLFPGGFDEKTKGDVVLFLKLLTLCKPLSMMLERALVTPAGRRHEADRTSGFVLFGPANKAGTASPTWTTQPFLTLSSIMDPDKQLRTPDDTVTFEVTLMVRASDVPCFTVVRPGGAKRGDFAQLLDSGLHSDVTLVVQGTPLPAHRALLAHSSPVFRAMFSHPMSETVDGKVVVDNLTPPVARELLGTSL